jgi:ribosomal protein S18 acetylase RimI-like enzyme
LLVISSTATFATANIEATLVYYVDVLGFESTWTWGDPPVFGSASQGGVTIAFNLQPELAANVRGHQHGIQVEDIDELYALHKARGARFVSEMEDKPWGMREYVVEDLNGYHLHFSGRPGGEAPKSKPFPEDVSLEPRTPSRSEFAEIAGKAFGYEELPPGLLEHTWGGVVATTVVGETIGVLRIMWDAPGWFSIWDVAILPEWQGRQIGTKMMREALALIRKASPGATVHLFSFKPGFYLRLGFREEKVSVCRV